MVQKQMSKEDSRNYRSNPFKLIRAAPAMASAKYTYFVSIQEIEADNGSKSINLAVKKQSYSLDGSPRGPPKQFFLPLDDARLLIEHIEEFLDEE